MLETIKKIINDEAKNAPFISFEQYFTRYVMQVQDENIDLEVAQLLRRNVTANTISAMIDQEQGAFNQDDKLL